MTDAAGAPSSQLQPAVQQSTVIAPQSTATGAVGFQRAGYGTSPYGSMPEEHNSLRTTLLQYLRIVLKRRWIIIGIASALLAIGLARTMMETPLYTASVRIQIEKQAAKIVNTGEVAAQDPGDTESLRTQFEILKSRSLAERVASIVKAGDDADLAKPRDFSPIAAVRNLVMKHPEAEAGALEASVREQKAVGIIALATTIRPVPGSRLVDIVYTDPSPARAARIANAYAEAYIAQSIDKRFQSNAYAKTFLEDQSKQLQLRLEDSEKALLEFSENKQIIVMNEKSTIAESNLAAANAALSTLAAERIRNEQIWRQVEEQKGTDLPQFLSNTVIQTLRASRKALESEYQEKLGTFKPAYPAMVDISSKIKEIDRQLAIEVKTIRASLKAAYEGSLKQEQETKAQIETLRAEVLDLQKKLIQYNVLKREADTNRSLYNGLLQRLKEVEVAGGVGTNNVFVVDRAQTPRLPTSPNIPRSAMIWLALGCGAGFAAAYMLELLDDTVRSIEELEQITSLATLGIIPKVADGASPMHELLDPRSHFSEAYRSFCTSLQFSTDIGLPKSMLITSSGPSEGKSMTAVAVSRHFATMGLKVLLIDGDLRNPSLHSKLDLQNASGLSNYLIGQCTPPEIMQATDVANLAFISTGPLPPNAADLLSGPRLMSLISVGLEVFDLILVDGPPVMGLADAQLLSSATSATVFVVGAGQARGSAVRGSLRRLELARAPLIGTVLTKFDARSAGYGYGNYGSYGYGYGYGHGYGYGKQNAKLPPGAPHDAQGQRPSLPNDTAGA